MFTLIWLKPHNETWNIYENSFSKIRDFAKADIDQ